MPRKKLITRLLYPLALRMKRWAESILGAESELTESEALPQTTAAQIENRNSTTDAGKEPGPPAHWLKRFASGPPLHWVEFVRSAAPELMQPREDGATDTTAPPPPLAARPARSTSPGPPLRLERPRAPAARSTESQESSARQVRSDASTNNEHQGDPSGRIQKTASLERTQERELSETPPAQKVRIDSPLGSSAPSSPKRLVPSVFSTNHPLEPAETGHDPDYRQPRTPGATRGGSSRQDFDNTTQPSAALPARPSRLSRRSAAASEFAATPPARSGDQMVQDETASAAIEHRAPPGETVYSSEPARNVSKNAWLEGAPSERAYPFKEPVEHHRETSSSASRPAPQPEVIYSRERDAVKWNGVAGTPFNECRVVPTQNDSAEQSRSADREAHFSALPSLTGSTSADPWPELPEAASVSYADELSETLRAIARQRRLEREQTGSIWSE